MGEFEVLIANEKVANVFNENEVEKIPLIIPGYEERQHYIIVIKKEYDYIDRERSDFTIWEEGNLIRPDLTGTYKSFFKMVIDPGLAHGKRIFRVENFNVAIIVNEEIKKAFQELEIKGVVFKEV